MFGTDRKVGRKPGWWLKL